ncbi:glycoside hydrolase family 43 [Methyloceanibacter methanicus]|uniref:Glycoside hydrolase family 43 n=1 Tax=Methyloceanibacter methanicus TaxID=1774968 RepID=A0A1E3W5H9_9HYPH|nr:HlyD family efflux transporter periplasmic adaptor subunit [Methyloceanibacter methanicus]ODS00377.1 glycoside hydrolase family 43 [Methyloceanibacter methanicus]
MTQATQTWLVRLVIVAVVAGAAYLFWQSLRPDGPPEGFAAGNGRIEATEIDVATKIAGRVKEIEAYEGDFVEKGQVLAVMDTDVLAAQLREAQAELQRAHVGVETARSQVSQREAEKAAAEASVAQREAELDAAQKRLVRSEELVPKGATSVQVLDDRRAAFEAPRRAVAAAEAQVAAADAAIGLAKSQVIGARAAVDATQATIERIKADIDDSTLRSPRDGRVQYRVAEPGEVLAAGGTVLNLVDLTDVYMTIFLPTVDAGRVKLGAEARIILDAAPRYVIPAKVSFVSDVAQFTPKTVETEEERLKLMFRIKARIDPALLEKYIRDVKTGLPGVAYVRLDPERPWPDDLKARLPE